MSAQSEGVRTAAKGIKAVFDQVTCFFLPEPGSKIRSANQDKSLSELIVNGMTPMVDT